jgi:hypothetical protein
VVVRSCALVLILIYARIEFCDTRLQYSWDLLGDQARTETLRCIRFSSWDVG